MITVAILRAGLLQDELFAHAIPAVGFCVSILPQFIFGYRRKMLIRYRTGIKSGEGSMQALMDDRNTLER